MNRRWSPYGRRRQPWLYGLVAGVSALQGPIALAAQFSDPSRVHGLWVWHATTILASGAESERLRAFALSEHINEVYLSVLSHGELADPRGACSLLNSLHHSQIRTEALLSSTNADEPGKHRERLLDEINAVIRFNVDHAHCRFDGIHLDLEPQQRPENKGPGNLGFVPHLIAAYREARDLARAAGLTLDVDVPIKVLKADVSQRRALFASVDRVTLMLYELNAAQDATPGQKADTLRSASRRAFAESYAGLGGPGLAELIIGLRTQDYGESLPRMFELLDGTFGQDSRYGGWARHAYATVQ
jgi:hypothetical protein